MTSRLVGTGIWLWQLPLCEGGNLDAIIAKARACGISWLAIKAGEKIANGQVTPELVRKLTAAGIDVAAWWYSHPYTVGSELAYLADLVHRCGVTALIMDAEEPWEREPNDWSKVRDWRREAGAFARDLRNAVGPDVYLADAPWARPKSHGGPFPYEQFGSTMDARHPQFYWQLAAPEAQTHFLATADLEWAAHEHSDRICPVGSLVNQDGTVHAPVAELDAFLDRYASREAVSIWSWQHLSPAEWAVLERRAVEARRVLDPKAALVVPPEPGA